MLYAVLVQEISTKKKLTLLKMQGVTQVDIFFDPDDAGLDAQNRVIELCEKVGLLYYGIKIRKELGDAGALTHENIKKLKRGYMAEVLQGQAIAIVETKPSRNDYVDLFENSFEFDQFQLCSNPSVKEY